MNMHNFELAIDDYNALLEIRPNNTVVQDMMQKAKLGLADTTQREKSICSKIFNKV